MTDQSPVFTAVQEDATSFCMDWPVFQGNGSSERQFRGAVFVLDCGGIRVSDTPMQAPNDDAADEALHEIGWVRCGNWQRDGFGRQSAPVMAVRVQAPAPRGDSWDDVRVERIGSLVDEAVFHLS